jgi:hypothetical protein
VHRPVLCRRCLICFVHAAGRVVCAATRTPARTSSVVICRMVLVHCCSVHSILQDMTKTSLRTCFVLDPVYMVHAPVQNRLECGVQVCCRLTAGMGGALWGIVICWASGHRQSCEYCQYCVQCFTYYNVSWEVFGDFHGECWAICFVICKTGITRQVLVHIVRIWCIVVGSVNMCCRTCNGTAVSSTLCFVTGSMRVKVHETHRPCKHLM